MSLLFPWLFTNAQGHYSLVPKTAADVKDSDGNVVPEEHGGIAEASRFHTLGSYAKAQLLNKDRRFAKDPSFLFRCMDSIEKNNIHSANRHTVRTGARQVRQEDVIDASGNYIKNKVTVVPHTIRSSYEDQF
jgi:hypothetical protein